MIATHVGDRLEDIERRGDSTVRSEKATLLLYNAAAVVARVLSGQPGDGGCRKNLAFTQPTQGEGARDKGRSRSPLKSVWLLYVPGLSRARTL